MSEPEPTQQASSVPEGQPPVTHYRFAIRRPVTIVMIFLTIIVFGWRSYEQLPINLMPDISYPTLTVRTEYEGAAPEDVEKLVTRPLEEMLSIVSGLVELSSVSSPGKSEIVLEFTWGTDMNVAQQDVRDRLDLFEPPKEVTEKPVILRYDPTLDPVMRVGITPAELGPGANTETEQRALTVLRDAVERQVKGELEAEVGIAQVEVRGGREEEIQVQVDTEKLKSLGLSLEAVTQALAAQNINLSGGTLQEGRTEYLVRTLNEFADVREIAASIIPTPSGQLMRLEDVAQVYLGAKDRKNIVRINGREAVELKIFKEGDANTVRVCDIVKDSLGIEREAGTFASMAAWFSRVIEEAQKRRAEDSGDPAAGMERDYAGRVKVVEDLTLLDRLPPGVSTTVISDQSIFIKGSIKEVQDAAVIGGALALIILYLFLREAKSTIIIGLALPISVIGTFVPMFMQDISLNIMSLGGIALGIGASVDCAIVVLESVFRKREEGYGTLEAAELGTGEVYGAVFASTLTNVCVFFPIAFVEGVAGQLFGHLAWTVTYSNIAAMICAFFLVPMIISRQGVKLNADREVVWLVSAYRRSRQGGDGPAAALAKVPLVGLKMAWEYLSESTADTFGPALRALRGEGEGNKAMLVFSGLFSLPLLALAFPLRVLLHLLAGIVVTFFFLFSVALLGFFVALAKALWIVFWLPLNGFNLGFAVFRRAYTIALEHSLRFAPIFLVAVAIIAVHAVTLARELGSELIPPMYQGEFGIRMEAPPGTRLQETESRASAIEAIVRQDPDVASVTIEVGGDDTASSQDAAENIAHLTVRLANVKDAAQHQDEVIARLRNQISRVSTDEIAFTLPTMFSFKSAVEVQIFGDDVRELRLVGERALEAIEAVQGVADAELSMKPGYPEIIIELDRELLAAKGITPTQVAMRLRGEVQGDVPTTFSRPGRRTDIRVRAETNALQSVEDLRKLSITDSDPPIPLETVANIRVEPGPSEVRRIDQRQVVLISANVEARDLGAVSEDVLAAVTAIDKPDDYYFTLGGQNRELQTSFESLRLAIILALFLVYVVMACQFESLVHPALVMFTVPLGLISVIYTLYFLDYKLSIMVFLGGIILVGIIVNNAIVLIDYVNQLRERGMKKREALVLAGRVRLRPIMMTTLTTVLGMVPMVFASGEGAELRKPMAVTLIAGQTFGTLLTLFVIPMAYDILGGRDKK